VGGTWRCGGGWARTCSQRDARSKIVAALDAQAAALSAHWGAGIERSTDRGALSFRGSGGGWRRVRVAPRHIIDPLAHSTGRKLALTAHCTPGRVGIAPGGSRAGAHDRMPGWYPAWMPGGTPPRPAAPALPGGGGDSIDGRRLPPPVPVAGPAAQQPSTPPPPQAPGSKKKPVTSTAPGAQVLAASRQSSAGNPPARGIAAAPALDAAAQPAAGRAAKELADAAVASVKDQSSMKDGAGKNGAGGGPPS